MNKFFDINKLLNNNKLFDFTIKKHGAGKEYAKQYSNHKKEDKK